MTFIRGAVGIAIVAVALAGCTASTPAPEPTSPATERFESGDRLTPIIMSSIGAAPIPVPGTDERVHLAYELTLLNASPRPMSVESISVQAEQPNGEELLAMPREAIVDASVLTGSYLVAGGPVQEVPSGGTVVVIMDVPLDEGSAAPARVVHEVSATFGDMPPGQAEYANNFPTEIVQVGGIVEVDATAPIVIGPPLTGDNWFAGNACCTPNGHRNAIASVGGRLNPTERYAVDWLQLDPTVPINLESASPFPSYDGDPLVNDSYFAFGQPLLAVADGEVVKVVDDQPEAIPSVISSGIPFDRLGGNFIVLALAEGVYAFYAHVQAGGVQVAEGDRVEKGQVIGLLGNTGNTSEAHLHFHLMNGVDPLDSVNLPWVIDSFEYQGQYNLEGFAAAPRESQSELPLAYSVIGFPLAR
ncbi:M23 family metallopeptidase [soil metagenome]